VIAGGVAGLAVSMGIAFFVYHMGRRLNIARFFKVIGALLMVFAAGILVDAAENLQKLGWIRFLDHPLWSSSGWLKEDSALGDVFHSFFGYSDHPTALQLIVYVTYLGVAAGAFVGLRPPRGRVDGEPPAGGEKVIAAAAP
jgi:high-affinity iron transporter